ncbi:hypothetical protein B296_00018063 [Ensete ventricosum]|uniref:Uncharacterized protein n=1 Tax=Ensete ventricosum TaxID=4639 RepID=A0A426XTJ5_ENSVE|nr:hypothetical protein B296_00018063 [Ensete ventricosum]
MKRVCSGWSRSCCGTGQAQQWVEQKLSLDNESDYRGVELGDQDQDGHRLDWLHTRDLGGRKRRSDGYSRRSRSYSISIALRKKMLAMPKGHKQLRAATAMMVAAEGDMSCDHRGSSSERICKKLSLDNEKRRGNLS